jgi:hypothetical protein
MEQGVEAIHAKFDNRDRIIETVPVGFDEFEDL